MIAALDPGSQSAFAPAAAVAFFSAALSADAPGSVCDRLWQPARNKAKRRGVVLMPWANALAENGLGTIGGIGGRCSVRKIGAILGTPSGGVKLASVTDSGVLVIQN